MEPIRSLVLEVEDLDKVGRFLSPAAPGVDPSPLAELTHLARVNILVGANNSGKSRLLRHLAYSQRFLVKAPEEVLRHHELGADNLTSTRQLFAALRPLQPNEVVVTEPKRSAERAFQSQHDLNKHELREQLVKAGKEVWKILEDSQDFEPIEIKDSRKLFSTDRITPDGKTPMQRGPLNEQSSGLEVVAIDASSLQGAVWECEASR